jgi:hypothetical protein
VTRLCCGPGPKKPWFHRGFFVGRKKMPLLWWSSGIDALTQRFFFKQVGSQSI